MDLRRFALEFGKKISIQRLKVYKNSYSFYHAHHMLDEIPQPRNVSVHRIMLNLIHQNRPGEALHVFKRHLQLGISGIDDFSVALASKASVGFPRIGCQIHGFALISGFMEYVSVCNSLMNMYCKSQDLSRALCIFQNLKNPDTVSFNTVLSGLEDQESALSFTRGMHSNGISFDAVTCTSALAHCTDIEEFGFGFQLHCLVSKAGLMREIFVGNALVTLYSKSERIIDAKRVFDEMPDKDLVSWNALLSGYAQDGNYGAEAILGFLEIVKSGMKLDHVSITSVISACSQERNSSFGKNVHGLSVKRGYNDHVSVCNVLMSMYSKCGFTEDARLVFENMVDHNVVTWTTIISINEEESVDLFKQMIRDGVRPNDVTFIALLHAITMHNTVQEGRMVHALCVKVKQMNVGNSFITMYGKFKLLDECIKMFEELEYRDIISWNSIISAYSLNHMYTEAFQAFLLCSNELTPNAYTFGGVLHAIASSESISLKLGQSCHCCIKKLGLDTNPVVSSALLDMYGKRGSISESDNMFPELGEQKSQLAWTSIISAHSRHGDFSKAIEYFNQMVKEGVKPDSITFLSLLMSCAHNGMVDAGIEIFKSMVDVYHVEPCGEHYSCIVDMLGRAGRLKEAEEVMGRIPAGPGVSVLQSLLGACRIYGEVEMGERVWGALIGMKHHDSGSYVMMSNLLAEKGRWGSVAEMRKIMRERRVIKEVGLSWVDVGNVRDSLRLHAFSSGDRSHSMCKEIYVMVELLGSEMKPKPTCLQVA